MSRFLNVIRSTFGMKVTSTSASVAKDRLSLMLVHQRNLDLLAGVDMEAMQKEIGEVVAKYVRLASNKPSHFSGVCEHLSAI